MESQTKIAIIGGGGRTGKYLVSQLVSQGFHLRLLLRNQHNASYSIPLDDSLIEIIDGDVLDFEAVLSLLDGCTAVISTLGQRKDQPMVAAKATLNILNAMAENKKKGCAFQRYILVAGLNVDTPFDRKSPETVQATDWMKANFPLIMRTDKRLIQCWCKALPTGLW